MTVLDVKGVSVSDITTDVISFIKQSSYIMDNYYPGSYVYKFICVNGFTCIHGWLAIMYTNIYTCGWLYMYTWMALISFIWMD
jgi:hypothetical protein